MNVEQTVTGRLENWYCQPVDDGEFVIWGYLYDDVKQRWCDGYFIHTSAIKDRAVKKGDVVETRNSGYLLGEPSVITLTEV